ncbi:MAG: TatD family hydrolase, partial [Patescibacteria group bacterium]
MLIDTHAHLNFSAFKNDADEAAKKALDENIWIINVGSQYSTSERAVKMAQKYPEGVYSAIGLHPVHLQEQKWHEKVDENEEFEIKTRTETFDKEKYSVLAKNKKVVAVGEIGLDYFHSDDNKKQQKEVFENQIDFAAEVNLPIMIHCRKAYDDLLEILRNKKMRYGGKLRGVVHSYLGNLNNAKAFTDLGFFLGFNGIITFARDYDKVLREIDLKYFLVETDCPYLAPVPFR